MLNKKLKLSLIAIATLVAGNVNAQTYYSCIPEECPSGHYFNGRKCLRICPSEYVWNDNRFSCCKAVCEYKSIIVLGHEDLVSDKGVKAEWYKQYLASDGVPVSYGYINLSLGDCYTPRNREYNGSKKMVYGEKVCCNDAKLECLK